MPDKQRINQPFSKRPNWKTYQTKHKRAVVKRKVFKSLFRYSALFSLLFIVAFAIIGGLDGTACHHEQTDFDSTQNNKTDNLQGHENLMAKKDVQVILKNEAFVNRTDECFDCIFQGQNLHVYTSLDIPLQQFMLENLDTSTSRYIGIVAMNPSSGRVLLMVGFDKTDQLDNPCINSRFPAASVFKIVTAAAAVEKCGFDSRSKLTFNGRKHTLYKSQLKDRTNKYTNRITFKDSFAQSINPVFGKIGALYLGKTVLEDYAHAFGFNRDINFEIPFAPSSISVSDKPYQLAEIASGFNRKTIISPLHGALMASVVLNNGSLIEPTIVDQIVDKDGELIYQSPLTTIDRAITPRTSAVITGLMEATIKSGTCRKAFRGYRRDAILSRLNIGGKSGSIDNKTHDARFDWFVGFAEEKDGPEKIVISVIVAHEKYIGKRASHYARIAMKQYFRDYFKRNKDKIDGVMAKGREKAISNPSS